jgi:hypothetical protein
MHLSLQRSGWLGTRDTAADYLKEVSTGVSTTLCGEM